MSIFLSPHLPPPLGFPTEVRSLFSVICRARLSFNTQRNLRSGLCFHIIGWSHLKYICACSVQTVSIWAGVFGFEPIPCIYFRVNHVEPEPSGVFVSVREGGTGVVKRNRSCHRALNEFELCNGLYVNKQSHRVSRACVRLFEDRDKRYWWDAEIEI